MGSRHLIEKTKRRLAKEVGTVYKTHPGRLRFAVAFPNVYRVGMSNLGFQVVYGLLNGQEGIACERVFLPDAPDMEYLVRSGMPLFTMESQTPVRDFDVLAFSLSYELDYPNVVKMLALSGLAEESGERSTGGEGPLVIAGGPAATFNPEPLSPFIDAFVIGEAEEVLPEVLEVLSQPEAGSRMDLLSRLACVEGVYVPCLYQPEYNNDGTIRRIRTAPGVPKKIRRRWVQDLDRHPATTAILTPETEFSNMMLVEVARGCGRQCRFCIAGYAFLPPRTRAESVVLDSIRVGERVLAHGDQLPRIGLIGASLFDHASSLSVCRALLEDNRQFSISSTRADTLDRDLAEILQRAGHETLTMAPEAGTDRLRQTINKAMTEEEILRAAASAWDAGFRRLKLYFMVGLPTETSDDVAGIPALVSEIAGMYRWRRVLASVSCFVPKPWTPFQWMPMEDEKRLAAKIAGIRQALRSVRRAEVGVESAREAVAQGVLARGDRRLRTALLTLGREKISWGAAFRKSGVDPSFYAQRDRRREEMLPWDHVDIGVRKGYLWRESERALKASPAPACVVGSCRRCGVCQG